MQLLTVSARVDGGARPGKPSRRRVCEAALGAALEAPVRCDTGLDRMAKTCPVRWPVFDV